MLFRSYLVLGAHSSLAPHIRQRLFWDSSGMTGYLTPVAQPANGTPEDFLRRKRESVARGSSMGITLSDLNMVVQTLTGYPTPTALSFNTSHQPGNNRYTNQMEAIAGYGTPRVTTNCGHGNPERSDQARLEDQVSGYVTPSTRDYKDTPGMSTTGTNPDGSTRHRDDQLPRQVHGLITESPNSATAGKGVLDAAFSRWLQGYPATWDEASPNYGEWLNVQDRIALAGCRATAMPSYRR